MKQVTISQGILLLLLFKAYTNNKKGGIRKSRNDMGTPVLSISPVLEDDRLYNCHLDCFGDGEGPHTCEDDYVGAVECCKTGLEIKTWLTGNCECNYNPPDCTELCFFNGVSAQRLLHGHGEYDDYADCAGPEDPCGCRMEGLPDSLLVTLSDLIECPNCACEAWCLRPNGVAMALNDHTFRLFPFEERECFYRLREWGGNYGGLLEWEPENCPPVCCEDAGPGVPYLFTDIILTVTLEPAEDLGPRAAVRIAAEFNPWYPIIGDFPVTFDGTIGSRCGMIEDSFFHICPDLHIGIKNQMVQSGNIRIVPVYDV